MKTNQKTALMPVDDALEFLLSHARYTEKTEVLSLLDAVGRTLAEDQSARVTSPPADNSAMDGYAVNTADLSTSAKTCLPVAQRISAGEVGQALLPGTVARIFTGAPVPEGANAVVMQEQCAREADNVELPTGVKSGQNIRCKGEGFSAGDVMLSKGSIIRPQDLGLLASMGVSEVAVSRKIKVKVFSTGNELVEPDAKLRPGQIYNANRYTLAGLIKGLGMEYIDGGILGDSYQATESAIKAAADHADMVITSGGVSVGEEDYVKNVVENLGQLKFWKLAIKPGKPLAFGELRSESDKHASPVPFFGLPGNPAAVLVTFCILVRPFLLSMSGAAQLEPLKCEGEAQFECGKAGTRREYLRARLTVSDEGRSLVSLHQNQSSGLLSAASWANGFAVVDAGQTVSSGDRVMFIPFSEVMG